VSERYSQRRRHRVSGMRQPVRRFALRGHDHISRRLSPDNEQLVSGSHDAESMSGKPDGPGLHLTEPTNTSGFVACRLTVRDCRRHGDVATTRNYRRCGKDLGRAYWPAGCDL
jgi:hypothetical protein